MNRPARLLLAGDGLSVFGGWIDFLAILTLAAWQFQVTPYEMALVGAAGLLPGMLAAPSIGRLCDRGDPKRLLLLSLVGRAGATAALLLGGGFVVFVALVALRSVFASVAPPAIHVLAVRAVPLEERPRFQALLNVLNNVGKVLAPAIGTVSSSVAGESTALALSLACSVAAVAVFAAVRTGPPPAPAARSEDSTRATPVPSMAPLIWIAATGAGLVFMVNNLVPLVLQRSGLDKSLLGVLVGCAGAGNVLSGLWLARRPAVARDDWMDAMGPVALQAAGFGAIGLLLAFVPRHAATLLPVCFFLVGMASARYAIALNVHLATRFADTVGRASGVIQAWQNAMILVAPAIGAVVLDRFGVASLFAVATGSAIVSLAVHRLLQRRPAATIAGC